MKMITRDYLGYDFDTFDVVTDKLKKTWKYACDICVSFGYARAAGELSRMGRYEDAKRVMLHLKKMQ